MYCTKSTGAWRSELAITRHALGEIFARPGQRETRQLQEKA